jgi:hypothetical protein
MSKTIQFNQILEMIDSLSVDEQDDLINLIKLDRE